MDKEEDVANKIRIIRQSRNLSQRRFGTKIGVSGKTISAYEKGRCTPSLKILDTMSQVYDVTFIHLKKGKRNQLKERLCFIKKIIEDIENTLLSSKDGEQ